MFGPLSVKASELLHVDVLYLKNLLVITHTRKVTVCVGASPILQKSSVKFQPLKFCDYTHQLFYIYHHVHQLLYLCDCTRTVTKKYLHKYGFPYWYGDANTRMAILRIWVLPYI